MNCARASANPITMIAASTTRRRKRRRVSSIGLSSAPPSASGSLCTRPRIARCTIATSTSAASSVSPAAIKRPDDESAATMRAVMAREGIPSAVLLDALGTLVELETPWPHLVGGARRPRRRGRRGRRARGDAGRDGLLPRPPRRGARLGRAEGPAPALRGRRAGAPGHRAAAGRRRGRAAGGDPLPRLPRGARACSRACAPAARAWPWSRNWDVSLHDVLERTGLRALRRRRRHLGRARARPSPTRRSSAPRSSGWAPRRAEAIARRRQRRARRRRRARGGPGGGARRPQRRRRRPTACASSRRSTGCSMT